MIDYVWYYIDDVMLDHMTRLPPQEAQLKSRELMEEFQKEMNVIKRQ